MKAVMISIQPKWCELIANRKKTIEVRKTKPKIETPFKCYIYCTKDNKGEFLLERKDLKNPMYPGTIFEIIKGKVIGEFVCDIIYTIDNKGSSYTINNEIALTNKIGAASCLYFTDMQKYLGNSHGYGWHISDLKIYYKPKELGEFNGYCEKRHECYSDVVRHCDDSHFDCKCREITRPPQSWCYVEENHND